MARTPSAVHRNRVIYQSEALFISPDATGYHYTGADGVGLSTPALDLINNNVRSVGTNRLAQGWNSDDTLQKWPTFCAGDGAGVAAYFNSTADSDNQIVDVTFTSDTFNATSKTYDLKLSETFNESNAATANAGSTASSTVSGFGGLKPDANATITIPAGAKTANTATGSDGILIFTGTGTYAGDLTATNNLSVDISTTAATGATLDTTNANAHKLTIQVDQLLADRDAVVTAITAAFATASINDISVSLVDPATGSTAFTTLATTAALFTGGANIPGTTTQPIPVQSFSAAIHVESVNADYGGEANGVTFIGDDTTDIDTFVLNYNTAEPDSKKHLKVVEGGTVILNAGVEIELKGGSNPCGPEHGSIIRQLKRVQTANYGFNIARTDVNQFGHLSRLDAIVLENPTVNLDISYFLIDGYNERMLEFVTNGYDNCLSGHLNPDYYQAGNNYFIVTVPEARDVVRGDVNLDSDGFNSQKTVISIGNGFVTDYSVDISVGAIPSASVTIEGMNIKTDIGTTGLNIPAVDLYDGSYVSNAFEYNNEGSVSEIKDDSCVSLFSVPVANSGYTGCGDIAALRPGDIVLDLGEKGLLSVQSSGNYEQQRKNGVGSAHIQSASLNLGMSRTNLQRLGSTFAFSKSLDVPINATLSVSAILSDLKQGNMADLICQCEEVDINLTIYQPECVACKTKTGEPVMRYTLKGAKIDSESFSSSIGDNKTVDLEFSVQLGGADDLQKGLFISGLEGNPREDSRITKALKPNKLGETDGPSYGGAEVWGLPPGFYGVDSPDSENIDDYRYNVPKKGTLAGKEYDKMHYLK